MTQLEVEYRKLRKEQLLFERKQKSEHKKFAMFLGELGGFLHLSPSLILSVLERFGKRIEEEAFLDGMNECNHLMELRSSFETKSRECPVVLIPTTWHLKGGGLASLDSFFNHIDELLYAVDDDIDVYTADFISHLAIRADRSGDTIMHAALRYSGETFRVLGEVKTSTTD